MSMSDINDSEFPAAVVVGYTEAEAEIRAQAVPYIAERDAIEVAMTCQAGS